MSKDEDPQAEQVTPQSKGGAYNWMNLVTACGSCNARNADRSPEQAKMPLVYLPHFPNRFEDFRVAGRNIRSDVHERLAARLPKSSRLI